jgi:hypothetical protein
MNFRIRIREGDPFYKDEHGCMDAKDLLDDKTLPLQMR